MPTALERSNRANAELRKARVDRWYPAFHIAARAGWLNDPNGVCYFRGRYHVFFQHHPDSAVWGPMHWGHASSPDLVTWRHEAIALAPGDVEDADGVWSGSAVTGDDGTLMVFYTGHRWRNGVDGAHGNVQVQCLATSTDGVHLTKQGVIVAGPPELQHFRDPFVWNQDGGWHMLLGASSVDERGQIWLYTSRDLRTWTFDRVLFTDPDPDVFMLECPDLFALGDRWVLSYGPMSKAKPSGYAGRNGHNCGYVVGTWTPGEDFRPITGYRTSDWGHNYYASQSLLAPDGHRIAFAWMGGFALPMASQADGWAGQLGVPRELTLGEDDRVRARPIAEIRELRGDAIDFGAFEVGVDQNVRLLQDAGPLDMLLEVDLSATSSEQVCVDVHRTSAADFTRIAYDDLSGRVWVDRGTNRATDRGSRSAPFDGGEMLRLRILVDRGSVEVFIGDGAETLSSLSFPAGGPRGVWLSSVSGKIAVASLVIYPLRSAWVDGECRDPS